MTKDEQAVVREAREKLQTLAANAGRDGASSVELAATVFEEHSELGDILGSRFERRWVAETLRRLRDENELPIYGSFRGRIVHRAFWTPDQFRRRRDAYVAAAVKNLTLAQAIAFQAQRATGAQLDVPDLSWPEERLG